MNLIFPAAPMVTAPINGSENHVPIHRIYCVGRNYEDHAKEMGFTGREPPFFFMKPADALLVVPEGTTGNMPYPSLTANLHHEVELVVVIGKAGKNIKATDAMNYIYGYAIGIDMTRRDLQNEMKKQGRPWCIGKAFDFSAPMGPITPKDKVTEIERSEIRLEVNGNMRQHSNIQKLIWNISETIEHLSAAWHLEPGDLIFTGTPEGVNAVVIGDFLEATITGLGTLKLKVC
jgi:fumarylpyruvate hydrolase